MMMENYLGMTLKRKELEEVNDDFCDFSFSSPALKIRRLDAELPPIIGEKDAEVPLDCPHSMQENTVSNPHIDRLKAFDIEELPMVPQNEEKAIVLFKPMTCSLPSYSHSNYSVDPNLISTIKNQAISDCYFNTPRPTEDESVRNGDIAEGNTCRAVIPWIPSLQLNERPVAPVAQTEVSEAMDIEEMEAATMEIEEACASNVGQHQATEYINHSRISEGLQHQWQQQHCMIPQPSQNVSTPIAWYR